MNKWKWLVVFCFLLAGSAGWFVFGHGKKKELSYRQVNPVYGRIERSITSTGTVQPQNRLEIKSSIPGRIEKILVEEGASVKEGDVLALVSSTDRAALMDAARLQGAETAARWEAVYKLTPLIAPISGEVIVRALGPGQSVTQADVVLVLSDRLVVQAQVDETDIGHVKSGQTALITLDAYPLIQAQAKVGHVAYEAKSVNNVTIYSVEVVPETVPDVFRSGMSANVKIIQEVHEGLLLIPEKAVKKDKGKAYVLLAQGDGWEPFKREIELGLSDGENVHVVNGLMPEDIVLSAVSQYRSSRKSAGKNPFMPDPGSGGGGRRGGS